jgi:hypothetical protein
LVYVNNKEELKEIKYFQKLKNYSKEFNIEFKTAIIKSFENLNIYQISTTNLFYKIFSKVYQMIAMFQTKLIDILTFQIYSGNKELRIVNKNN